MYPVALLPLIFGSDWLSNLWMLLMSISLILFGASYSILAQQSAHLVSSDNDPTSVSSLI